MVVESDIDILVPVLEKENISTQLVYLSPIKAPIAAGTKIAELIVSIPELADKSFPVVAGETVAEGNFWGRFKASTTILGKLLVTKVSKVFQ